MKIDKFIYFEKLAVKSLIGTQQQNLVFPLKRLTGMSYCFEKNRTRFEFSPIHINASGDLTKQVIDAIHKENTAGVIITSDDKVKELL
jgi:hypothetical protein